MRLKDLRKLKNMDKDDILEMFGLESRPSVAAWLAGALGTFGMGVLVGAGIGLLLAPKPGRELRGVIKHRLRRASQDAGNAAAGLGMGRESMSPSQSY